MKTFAILYSALVFSILAASCQPAKNFEKHGGLEIKASFTFFSQDTPDEMLNVIKKRLSHFNKGKVDISFKNNTVSIRIPGLYENEEHRVRVLLESPGAFGIWETFELSEIYPFLEDANRILASLPIIQNETYVVKSTPEDELMENALPDSTITDAYFKKHPLFTYLSIAYRKNMDKQEFIEGPVVGYSLVKDTARINKYLSIEEVKAVLPRNLKLIWSANPVPTESSYMELIAIKLTSMDGKAPMDGQMISNARVSKTNEEIYVINMEMTDEGSRSWKAFTHYNTGRAIAFVIDEKVYSYPWVMHEISEGKSQLNAGFDQVTASDLCSLINSGVLPYPLKIAEIQVIHKP